MNNKTCRRCRYFNVEKEGDSIILDCPYKYQVARSFDILNKEPLGTTPANPTSFAWIFAEDFFESFADECGYYENTNNINKIYYRPEFKIYSKIGSDSPMIDQLRKIKIELLQQQGELTRQLELVNKLIQEKENK